MSSSTANPCRSRRTTRATRTTGAKTSDTPGSERGSAVFADRLRVLVRRTEVLFYRDHHVRTQMAILLPYSRFHDTVTPEQRMADELRREFRKLARED